MKVLIHHASYHFLYFQAKDLIQINEAKCKNKERFRPSQLSCDGVSECKSNLRSLDVYSARFKGCRMVYPHTLVRPLPKYKVDSSKYLSNFIKDMHENQCVIKAFIADNLKRANAREALNHASSFACEYCFSKAVSHTMEGQQILEKKRKFEQQKASIEARIDRLQEDEAPDQDELETLNLLVANLTSAIKDIEVKKKK